MNEDVKGEEYEAAKPVAAKYTYPDPDPWRRSDADLPEVS